MSKQEVRVGQVWRLNDGDVVRINDVSSRRVLCTCIDGKMGGSISLSLFANYTLVQDAPGAIDWTAGGRWKPEADGYPDPAFYVHGKGLVPVPEAAFQQDACSALRGTLPKSERFAQSRLEHIGMDGELAVAAACAADLRRKVSSLRSWPVCPLSKQELQIEATVSEDVKGHMGAEVGTYWSSVGPDARRETLRTWQAAFTCPHCTGGRR